MELTDSLPLKGRYTIRRADTGDILVAADNLITTLGKALIGDMLRDESGYDTGLTYVAVGTGTTAPVVGNTTLVTETIRGVATSKTRSGNVLTISRFFNSVDVSIFIREVGVFGHSTASGTAGSGLLFSRALVSYDNTVNEYDLLVDYELTIG